MLHNQQYALLSVNTFKLHDAKCFKRYSECIFDRGVGTPNFRGGGGFAHKWQISLPLDLLKAWKRYPPLAATSEEGETRLSSSRAREFRSVWLK